MYIRLTSRCNMTCAHCGFGCTAKGEDMNMDTFRAALKLATDYGSYITLGGGEPTLHAKFWEMFGLALASFHEDSSLHIVTNGTQTETAVALAKMAKSGLIGAALSQDKWHRPVDPRVVEAFSKGKMTSTMYGWLPNHSNPHDLRSINQVTRIIDAGRAKKNGIGQIDDCFCDDVVIEPSGKLWMCGCRKKSFGTVFAPEIPSSYMDSESRCSEREYVYA